ncbi:unnamed protein product [Peniophora sp. CBMAI 1063]|nr:unnamed protein product [Peniophora sp. CBMAI 1063]
MSLYDWIRLTEKQKTPKKKEKPIARDSEEDPSPSDKETLLSDTEQDETERPVTRGSLSQKSQQTLVDEEDTGYSSDDTLIAEDEEDEDYYDDDDDDDDDLDDDLRGSRSSKSKKGRGTFFQFSKDHPQHKTHRIRMASEDQAKIPNFIGGILPRRDKGDVDEYCRAMLTLFKPWNDALSLKAPEQTWQAAYETYEFTPRDRTIMGFFHVRYECNDARDDFRAQRVSQARDNGLHWVGGQFIHELDREAWATSQLEALGDDMSKIDHAFEPMRYGQRMVNSSLAMAEMKHALESVGWVNPTFHNDQEAGEEPESSQPSREDSAPSDIDDPEQHIDVGSRTLSQWRDMLAEKRKTAIAQKAAGIPENDSEGEGKQTEDSYWEDQVRIIDKSFLSKNYKAGEEDAGKLVDDIVQEFKLNEEQERAFRIIANHSILGSIADPLRMYIGGMAGTGKSQVIKAVIKFFEAKGKSYAFLILAPTGSAASLIGGSTYHSALGFRGSNKSDVDGEAKGGKDPLTKGMSAQQVIKARLKAVEYVFIDEISMVDCQALYNISLSMNTAMNISDAAFANKNMIFAGDFAQLPPITKSGPPLYSGLVSSVIHTSNSVQQQKASIGKALWHQFTVVVLLTQNMRQRSQSEEDARFRKLIPRDGHPDIDLMHPDFVHASMITRRNSNRDLLNQVGTARFARAKKRKLYTFYAVDTFSNAKVPANKAVFEHNPLRTGNVIPKEQAEKVLSVPPGDTMSIPGKLTLCKGLPVIIKRNDATELNVTNGAEATVREWRSSTLSDGRSVLDVVFVELKNPPSPVKLDGLPLNVVPICRSKQNIFVEFPDATVLPVNRDQVPLLPNFAMTDYASQGRTRPINIVDLEHCDTHQSVYTCLSRASTLKGTVIFRMCNHATICGGLKSGRLKQEFRELELLNEITRLRWEGNLRKGVAGNTRSTLLKSYLQVYGHKSCPKNIHSAIKWGEPGESDPLKIDYDDDPSFVWKSMDKKTETKPGKDHKSSTGKVDKGETRGKKRKISEVDTDTRLKTDIVRLPKKSKSTGRRQLLKGMRWRRQTQTCAYDSLLTILANVYWHNAAKWGDVMHGVNSTLEGLVQKWSVCLQSASFEKAEEARDTLQKELNRQDPESFPINGQFTDMGQLIMKLFEDESGNRARYTRKCASCNAEENPLVKCPTWTLPASSTPKLLSAEIKRRLNRVSDQVCVACGAKQVREEVEMNVQDPPPFIAVGLEDRRHRNEGACQPKLTATVTIGEKGSKVTYKLRGLIYWNGSHFTCRMIGRGGEVYYNDGMSFGATCAHEASLSEIKELYNIKGAQLTYAILSLL